MTYLEMINRNMARRRKVGNFFKVTFAVILLVGAVFGAYELLCFFKNTNDNNNNKRKVSNEKPSILNTLRLNMENFKNKLFEGKVNRGPEFQGEVVNTTEVTDAAELAKPEPAPVEMGTDATSDFRLVKLGDLGHDLGYVATTSTSSTTYQYGETTGSVTASDVVIGEDGAYYANSSAASNASSTGTTTPTEVMDPNPGYEIVDGNGNTVATGEGSIPPGYAWDPVLGAYIPEDQVGLYMIDENGYIVLISEYVASQQAQQTGPTQATSSYYYTDPYGNLWASSDDYNRSLDDPDSIYYDADSGCFCCPAKGMAAPQLTLTL